MRAMGVVDTSEGKIGFTRSGDGATTPLIFLHGVGSDKSVWHPQLAHFGRSRPCFAFDYPGYGESEFSEGATRDDFARAIVAAMDALDIERAHVCGLSLGGVIAIAIHHLAPERIASLILADTFAVHPDGRAIYDRAVNASRTMSMRDIAEARAAVLLGSAATPAILGEVIETMSRIDPRAYALGADAVWLADQRDRVTAIDVPTLVLVGEEDAITPPTLSADLAGAIKGVAMTTIAHAGHLANLEQPQAFNWAIDQFLREIE
jgi:3-oxoadipate enol-lactonase